MIDSLAEDELRRRPGIKWAVAEPDVLPDWLAEAKATLARNRELVATGLPPGIRHHTPEATYLAWLDCRALDLTEDPATFFLRDADVLLSPSPDYGAPGFVRLNFATSGPLVSEMLTRMGVAVAKR